MNTNCLEKLEYFKILENLSDFCCTYKGKELVSNLVPSSQQQKVKELLNETRRSLSFIRSCF